MTLTASPPFPIPTAGHPDRAGISDGQRAGPSGRGLFEAAADLLAAANAVAANADARDSDVAIRPALACVEASLHALAEAAERMGEECAADSPGEWVSRPIAALRFDRLAGALRSATVACGDARRVAAGNA